MFRGVTQKEVGLLKEKGVHTRRGRESGPSFPNILFLATPAGSREDVSEGVLWTGKVSCLIGMQGLEKGGIRLDKGVLLVIFRRKEKRGREKRIGEKHITSKK